MIKYQSSSRIMTVSLLRILKKELCCTICTFEPLHVIGSKVIIVVMADTFYLIVVSHTTQRPHKRVVVCLMSYRSRCCDRTRKNNVHCRGRNGSRSVYYCV